MMPRVLLVEDDPVNAMFLGDALESFPAQVDVAVDCAEAMRMARANAYDAWMIDSNLPDGNGSDLLRRLRTDDLVPRRDCPALAHTADAAPEIARQLETDGFVAVVRKPSPIEAWHRALAALLSDDAAAADWDDVAALRALGGRREHVETMRGLFRAELPAQRDFILGALERGDADAARGMLHRLKASCGFVGALALAQAARDLHEQPLSQSARSRFSTAIDSALADAGDGSR
ncbi:Hpt domain-containing response regulator [Solilutibacter silvestris]|uniref:Response regulator receiver domain-containing protein n=1 Tax=Solilutibacter silvestris TaxID=1645665 RepID=A0A2K1Q013_9GAMM|nr:response regulator [Lysobacter silvestris]PNS08247.1 Response regulator receiver domain-containing protein [Lysobacter silvestris]